MLSNSSRANYPFADESSFTERGGKDYENDCATFKAPYFNVDIRSKMLERAKKENLMYEQQVQEQVSKGNKVDHLGKAGRIVEELIKKHGMAKEKISKLKEEATKHNEKECSFKPQNISGEKFVFRGNIIQRNQIWLE